jgi:hypothetical protein
MGPATNRPPFSALSKTIVAVRVNLFDFNVHARIANKAIGIPRRDPQ